MSRSSEWLGPPQDTVLWALASVPRPTAFPTLSVPSTLLLRPCVPEAHQPNAGLPAGLPCPKAQPTVPASPSRHGPGRFL